MGQKLPTTLVEKGESIDVAGENDTQCNRAELPTLPQVSFYTEKRKKVTTKTQGWKNKK